MFVAPLTDLLKKDVFHWFTKSQQAFNSLKTTLTHAPMLALLNFAKPFIPVTLLNDGDKGPILQPSIILDRRKFKKKNGGWLSKVLIKWKELHEKEAIWEGEHEIQQLYRHFEDKVNFNGGAIDTNNNIMEPKNKNSQTMEEVKRSTNGPTTQVTRELFMLKSRRRDSM